MQHPRELDVIHLGGRIYCNGAPGPTISHCVLEDNTAAVHGGGFGCYYSNPIVEHCLIRANHCGSGGGGVYSDQGHVGGFALLLENCEVSGNSADDSGGGIQIYRGAASIVGCRLTDNSATGFGGAVYANCVSAGYPSMLTRVERSVIAGNQGTGALWMDFASAEIAYCTLSENVAGLGAIGFWNEDSSSLVGVIVEGTQG